MKSVEVRWSDLDPNFHMRHSAYYDLGAVARLDYLTRQGVTTEKLKEESIGLVILREECIFRREVLFQDALTIDIRLLKATKDYERWTVRHHIYKNGKTLAAVITLDGAWIDLVKRKLTSPSSLLVQVMHDMPKADSFEYV